MRGTVFNLSEVDPMSCFNMLWQTLPYDTRGSHISMFTRQQRVQGTGCRVQCGRLKPEGEVIVSL